MTTISNEFKKACLDGGLALFNNGSIRFDTSGDAELATVVFGATAFGAATTASPSVAVANATTPDSSPTAGTIAKFLMRTSAPATRINGSVGVGSGDLQVSDNVIPGDATEVDVDALTISLQITG